MRLVGQELGEETWREDRPVSEPEMKREGRRMAGRHGGREGGKEGGRERGKKRDGRKETEERHLGVYNPYFLSSKTPAGCHSIKAITLALLAILEIKFGLLKLYTKKPVG